MEILYPIFALVALTAFVLLRLGVMRAKAIKQRDIDYRFFETYRDYDEPEHLRIGSRHLVNLFETPILFYVVTILILVTEQTGPLLLGLAWAYVTARYLHTYIHLTSNKVLVRFKVFIFSFFLLVMMWIAFAVQVIRTA
jgi:hypothetical protein